MATEDDHDAWLRRANDSLMSDVEAFLRPTYDELLAAYLAYEPVFRHLEQLSENHENHQRKERPQNEPGE